jgi:hypothetical protein
MTNYPRALDSDLELPRIESEVSEISGDYVNSLRDAIIAIQKSVGIAPQGNKASLTDRMNTSIDANGYIKKEALEDIGLVTLPIVDKHVGQTAGIKETKLALDYNTRTLKNMIESMKVDVNGLISGLASLTNTVSMHTIGASGFHDGYHIKINLGTEYGITGLEASTVGDAINELAFYLTGGSDLIIPHLELELDGTLKHIANNISIDASNFTLIDRNSKNVQEAFDSLDSNSGALGIDHARQSHSNGIFKNIYSGTNYNVNDVVLASITGISYDESTGIVKFNGITSFSNYNIAIGDILYIHEKTGVIDSGTYQIRAIGPLVGADTLGGLPVLAANEIAIFHTFVESHIQADAIIASIYKPITVPSDDCPFACAVKNNETIVDTITIMNPKSARVVSIGFNGSILNADGYEIEVTVGVGPGIYRSAIIPNLNEERLGLNQAVPVDAKSVAERINAYVSDPNIGIHFPISAYAIGNELAIAHNWIGPDYTLKIENGQSGNFALGLDSYGANVVGSTIYGNEGSACIISGTKIEDIKILFEGYASIAAASSTFLLWSNDGVLVDPTKYNISSGSVMHVTGHSEVNMNGSYTLMSVNTTAVTVFPTDEISAPTNPTIFNVTFTASNVALTALDNTETDNGIVQIYLTSDGDTILHQRLLYGGNLGTAIEIVNLSNGFPEGELSIYVGFDGEFVQFNIFDDTLAGDSVRINRYFKGSFKLYHPNGLDYLFVKITDGTILGGLEIIKVVPSLPDGETLLLCTMHFNGALTITNLVDSRLFGTLNTNQIRDDFIEQYCQTPVADLRSNGVARGFDLIDVFYYDTVTGAQAIPLRGGIAYVNGVRLAVETQKVIVQSSDSEGHTILNGNFIVAINEYGSIQSFNDELGEMLMDGYNSDAVFGKLLPLYYVKVTNGEIGDVIDIRKFICNIDDKIELIVSETNGIVGNFRTLEGALLYAEKYPASEKLNIKIVNSIYPVRPIVVPNGVSIIGTSPYGGNGKHQIINKYVSRNHFITLEGNNRLENIEIISELTSLSSSLVYLSGSNISIERCSLRFEGIISTYESDIAIEVGHDAEDNIKIIDNKINNVYSGIVSEFGVYNLFINKNDLVGIQGTNGLSYGIKIETRDRPIKNLIVSENSLDIPSVVTGTDLRGIEVDIGFGIDILRIKDNNIIHASQNTMTNGIRIAAIDGYTGVADQVFITGNVIDGIKLDDNYVFGIYVTNSNRAIIDHNTLLNIGVYSANRTDVAAIRIASTSAFTDITNNIIKSCDVLKGIEIDAQQQDSRLNISDNTLIGLGKYAEYIRGSTACASINNNILTGPGLTGIRWSGTGSKISCNNINRPNTMAEGDYSDDYAFEAYAIYTPTSDVDITDNTISGMIFSSGSIGISNGYGATGRYRAKIVGNTINGSLMSKLIEVCGAEHIINSNRLLNESLFGGQDTLCIDLGTVSNSLIMGNFFQGSISNAITSSGTAVDGLTIVNNNVGAELIDISSLQLLTAANCMIVGNRFPDGSTEDNTIGGIPSYGVYNTNIFGINVGMQDTRGFHASSAISGYNSTTNETHWIFDGTNSYWCVNSGALDFPRLLYFPIIDLPNGAKINAVRIQGQTDGASLAGTFVAQIFKRSTTAAGMTISSIGSQKDMSTATGEFGNSLSLGQVIAGSNGNVINYSESNYYLQITHTGILTDGWENIRIYGITVEFTY